MAKFRPGIPEGFDLNVAPVKPVADLGDYLDEQSVFPARPQKANDVTIDRGDRLPSHEVARVAPPAAEPPPPVPPTRPVSEPLPPQAPPVNWPAPIRLATPAPQPPAPRDGWGEEVEPLRHPKEKAPRREISMTPETLRMSDELLDMIRSATGQRDAKANELFHAAILLLYEVRGELDLHTVPKRGKWGTPMARAFPVALKRVFLEAVIVRAKKDQRHAT